MSIASDARMSQQYLPPAALLDPYAQCGGINNAPQPDQSGDFAWSSTACLTGWTCLSNANPWYWQVCTQRLLHAPLLAGDHPLPDKPPLLCLLSHDCECKAFNLK